MTFYQYPDYMYHYGVKGMKWGVRRAERIEKKQKSRREKYINKTSRKIKKNKELANFQRSKLRDYKKYGTNHQDVIDLAKEKADSESSDFFDKYYPDASETFKNASSKFNYELRSSDFKQQAYDELVNDTSEKYKYYSKQAKKWTSANKQVMDLPLDSSNKDYRKAMRSGKKIISISL